MSHVKRINQNRLKNLIERNKKLGDFSNLEPIIASNDGYMLTADGQRIIGRVYTGTLPVLAIRAETKPLGTDANGLSADEAFAFLSRLGMLPEYEQIALDLQLDLSKVRKSLVDLYLDLSKGKMPDAKKIVAASIAIRETE